MTNMNELKLLRRRVAKLEASETKLKQIEEALGGCLKRFEDIAENALEWFWEVDNSGKYIYASPAVEKTLGYSPEEMLEKHFYDMFYPEEREALKKTAFMVFAKKEPFRGLMNRNVHKRGKTVWLSTSGVPVFNKKRGLIGYRGADIDVTAHKSLEDGLRESRKGMRDFLGRILSIREQDKKKLARNLHDEVGSMSIILGSRLSVVEEEIKGNNLQGALKNVRRATDGLKRAVESLRGIAINLRPPSLDVIGIVSALKEHFSNVTKQTKIKVSFSADVDEKEIDSSVAIVLYRVAQEALTNTIRHAKAQRVKVKLRAKGSDIELNICDDGRGFDAESALQEVSGLGIRGMKESVESLAGEFVIKSTSKKGTQISAVLPGAGRSKL